MPYITAIWIAFGGFFAGLIWLQFFGRAIRLILTASGKVTIGAAPFVPKGGRWAIPLLLINPAPWLLLAILWLAYATYSGLVPSMWAWFVGGFFLSVLLNWSMVFVVVYRAKKKRTRAEAAAAGR
jgi:hypothetical protein